MVKSVIVTLLLGHIGMFNLLKNKHEIIIEKLIIGFLELLVSFYTIFAWCRSKSDRKKKTRENIGIHGNYNDATS